MLGHSPKNTISEASDNFSSEPSETPEYGYCRRKGGAIPNSEDAARGGQGLPSVTIGPMIAPIGRPMSKESLGSVQEYVCMCIGGL